MLDSVINLMRSGVVPLIPNEERFLDKVDSKGSFKLSRKDEEALGSFLRRVRLGIAEEDDAEFESPRWVPFPKLPEELPRPIPLPIKEPEREPMPIKRFGGFII